MGYENINAVKLGEDLKALRIENGETIEELAKAINTSASAVGMYECGKRIPRDEIKIRIAEHYQRSVESIFFRKERHVS